MKRIAIISTEFGDKIYDFKLYARILLTYEGKVSVEYTEKVCEEVATVYTMQHDAPFLAKQMAAEALKYQDRLLGRIKDWEALAENTAEGAQDE